MHIPLEVGPLPKVPTQIHWLDSTYRQNLLPPPLTLRLVPGMSATREPFAMFTEI